MDIRKSTQTRYFVTLSAADIRQALHEFVARKVDAAPGTYTVTEEPYFQLDCGGDQSAYGHMQDNTAAQLAITVRTPC